MLENWIKILTLGSRNKSKKRKSDFLLLSKYFLAKDALKRIPLYIDSYGDVLF
jgi:hypothetical protein